MTPKPPYVVHEVDEKDVSVDWFFGSGHVRTKVVQLVLVLGGWFFAILPIVITASALLHRGDATSGWWGYHEGFVMWDLTIATLGILTVAFVIFFFVMFLANRRLRRDEPEHTYDEERLAQRLEIASTWYAGKFGPEDLRHVQRNVRIEPHSDVETYELRGLYRFYEVD